VPAGRVGRGSITAFAARKKREDEILPDVIILRSYGISRSGDTGRRYRGRRGEVARPYYSEAATRQRHGYCVRLSSFTTWSKRSRALLAASQPLLRDERSPRCRFSRPSLNFSSLDLSVRIKNSALVSIREAEEGFAARHP
jgi:hypothetical protein